jgi:Ca-dependent carbohydrate-binding module xylan-binding/Right handed beta helix region
MTGAVHSDWFFEHAHHHAFTGDAHNPDPPATAHTTATANTDHASSVASVLKTLWLSEPPALTVGSSALTVDEGGSIALPISVAPSGAHDATTVTIAGLASYETITDHLDHTVFTASSGAVTLTAAEVNSGLTLSSDYAGSGHPVNTLTVTASETHDHQTLSSAPQTIQVTDPKAATSSTSSGSNLLTLQVSGDNYQGDPTIKVLVDGKQVGSSSYTITADHSSGQWQTITISGNFSTTAAHQVQIEFTNDAWSGVSWWSSGGHPDGNDRDIYVQAISLNGETLTGSQATSNTATNGVDKVSSPTVAVMDIDGTLAFTVAAASTGSGTGGSGSGGSGSGGSGSGGSGSGGTGGSGSGSGSSGTLTVGTGAGTTPSGAGFYVSPTGSDSNPGTLAAPFATLAKAQQAMEGSSTKTTYVEGGTYHLTSTLTLTSADNGESWDYYPASGVDSAILTGGGSLTTMIELGANNVTIDGLTIEDYGSFGIHHDVGANATPLTGITIENCDIGDSTATGTWQSGAIFIGNVNGITIANNYIFNVQSMGIALYAYSAGNVLDNVSITGNVVVGAVQGMTDGGAIYVNDHSGYHGSNISITNNYVADYGSASSSRAAGIYLDDSASYWTVSGNVIGPPNPASPNSSQSDYAVEVNNGSHNTITNNIIDLGSTGNVYDVLWYYGDNPTTSLTGPSQTGETFANNIVISNFSGSDSPREDGTYAFYENSGSAGGYTIDNNVYYNYGGGQMLTNGPVASDANPSMKNPMLSGWDYVVASNSPAMALGFKTIAGGWGPAGFTIPEIDPTPSDV